jgi:hypothetical protein
MSNLLLTDSLNFTISYGEKSGTVDAFYDDYIKDVISKAFEVFAVSPEDTSRLALFDENGERLPNSTRIYDNAELVSGAHLILKRRDGQRKETR